MIEASSSVHPIKTRTEGLEGFLELDVHDGGKIDVLAKPKGELSLEVARLRSGNPLEDRELRRRIDARRFPTIDGKMTDIQETATAGHFRVRGDLTFRGVTQSYEDEITITPIDDRALRVEGERTFDVREFGMEPPRILMLRVHPEVKVRIDLVAQIDD